MDRKGSAKRVQRETARRKTRRKPRNTGVVWKPRREGASRGVGRSGSSASVLVKSDLGGDLAGGARVEWVEGWMHARITFESLGSGED